MVVTPLSRSPKPAECAPYGLPAWSGKPATGHSFSRPLAVSFRQVVRWIALRLCRQAESAAARPPVCFLCGARCVLASRWALAAYSR